MLTDELIFLLLVVVGSLGLLVGAPAAILVWLELRWRVAAFLLGIGLAACLYWPGAGGDPRGWWVMPIALSLGTSIAALLIEVPALIIRTVRRARRG